MGTSFLEDPPSGDQVTDYDRRNCAVYLRLLDAEAGGAHWRAIAEVIFHLDPIKNPAFSERLVANHLKRAKWMSRAGFSQFLRRSRPTRFDKE